MPPPAARPSEPNPRRAFALAAALVVCAAGAAPAATLDETKADCQRLSALASKAQGRKPPPVAAAKLRDVTKFTWQCATTLRDSKRNDKGAIAESQRKQAQAAWDAALKAGAKAEDPPPPPKPKGPGAPPVPASAGNGPAIAAYCAQLLGSLTKAGQPVWNDAAKAKALQPIIQQAGDMITRCIIAGNANNPEARQLAEQAARAVDKTFQLALHASQHDDGGDVLAKARKCVGDLLAAERQLVAAGATAAVRTRVAELRKLMLTATNAIGALGQCRAVASDAYVYLHKKEAEALAAAEKKLRALAAQTEKSALSARDALLSSPDYKKWRACVDQANGMALRAATFGVKGSQAGSLVTRFKTMMPVSPADAARMLRECNAAVAQAAQRVKDAEKAFLAEVDKVWNNCTDPAGKCRQWIKAAVYKLVPPSVTLKTEVKGAAATSGVMFKGGFSITYKLDRNGDVFPFEFTVGQGIGAGTGTADKNAGVGWTMGDTYKFELNATRDLRELVTLIGPTAVPASRGLSYSRYAAWSSVRKPNEVPAPSVVGTQTGPILVSRPIARSLSTRYSMPPPTSGAITTSTEGVSPSVSGSSTPAWTRRSLLRP